MTSLNQADWYDDPNDPTAQRYYDGANWTPHRRRRPIQHAAPPPPRPQPPLPTPTATPSQPPPPMAPPPPPPPPMNSSPHPGDVTTAIQSPPPSQPTRRGRSRRRKIMLAIAAVVVVVVAGAASLTAYHYFFAKPPPPSEGQFAQDVAAAGVMSADPAVKADMNLPAGAESTARINAVATAVCADLTSGANKDAEATQVYQGALAGTPTGGAPLPHDKAVKIVDLAIQDVCPGK
jgi:hypothetical protein